MSTRDDKTNGAMNGWLCWFGRLTWVGVAVNLSFILPAFFAADAMEAIFGPGSTEFAVFWLPYAGFTLLFATCFYLPAAIDPLRFHVYAWLSVVGRGMAFAFWMWQNSRWDLDGPITTFWVTDGVFFVIFLVLLQIGMPPEWKISGANLSRVFASWGDAFAGLFRPSEDSNAALRAHGIFAYLVVLGNLAFAIPALLTPQTLNPSLGGVTDIWAYLWLGNAAMLLCQISLFMLPAASYPVRYRPYAWLTTFGWLASCLFWVWQTAKWGLTGTVSTFRFVDIGIFLVLAITLQKGLAEEGRFSLAAVGRTLGHWLSHALGVFRSPIALVLLLAVLAGGGFLAKGIHDHLLKVEPDKVFDDPAEQYKYGAIGLAIEARVPLYVWEVIPELCGDQMPDPALGWASFGLIYEEGKSIPIGFAERQIGYPSVEPTCSLCHTGNYRTEPGGARQLALGGPAHMLDLEAFQWFLYECAASAEFTPKNVLSKIEAKHELGFMERLMYQYAIIPSAKMGLATQKKSYAWQKSRPSQGRGRTDTFNPTKLTVFRLPDDGTIGTVDLPAVWNQKAREGMWLHWDGNNNKIHERNYAAAMAVGATPNSVVPSHFKLVTDYLLQLEPTKYPLAIDEEKAARGGELFATHCADCHAFGSEKVGTVTDISEIGTDSHRLYSFTEQLVDNFHTVHEGRFQFDAYRKTQGYSNLPIDGIWVRAPYLHNGSVPTLWDLLQAPQDRPKKFYKGYEVFDAEKVGFVHQGAEAEKVGFLLDTSVPGNGNGGHLYGTDLTDEEKWDLVEYLKTL